MNKKQLMKEAMKYAKKESCMLHFTTSPENDGETCIVGDKDMVVFGLHCLIKAYCQTNDLSYKDVLKELTDFYDFLQKGEQEDGERKDK